MNNINSFDPETANVVAQWPHDQPLTACRFTPDGNSVLCGSQDALVQKFALSDGQKASLGGGHDTWVRAFGFDQDGSRAISGGSDGRLAWWDLATTPPSLIRSVDAHRGWIRSIDTSADGKLIVSGGNDNRVCIWDTDSAALVREFAGHQSHIYSVAFHPSGEFLFSGDLTGSIRQWDAKTGKEIRAFDAQVLHSYNEGQKVDFGGVRALAISPDGCWLAAGGLHKATNPLGAIHEPIVALFNWETGQLERQQIAEGITKGVLWRLSWVADGSLMGLCGGGDGGFLIFWKPDAEKDHFRFKLPSLARDMDLHPDGLRVATAHYDRHLRITQLATANS